MMDALTRLSADARLPGNDSRLHDTLIISRETIGRRGRKPQGWERCRSYASRSLDKLKMSHFEGSKLYHFGPLR